jgi:hypothetical protein
MQVENELQKKEGVIRRNYLNQVILIDPLVILVESDSKTRNFCFFLINCTPTFA